MKIVHEIYGLPQSGGGGIRPYAQMPGAVELPVDGYIDEIIVCADDEECMRFEGSLSAVRYMLASLLSMVDTLADIEVKRGKLDPEWKTKGEMAMIRRETECPPRGAK